LLGALAGPDIVFQITQQQECIMLAMGVCMEAEAVLDTAATDRALAETAPAVR
jgi:hypothetical protein